MRQHIDTMPVWDAYKSGCECPLCQIQTKNEEAYVENFLGASVMEPDHRVAVNEKGFCTRHFQMMFEAGNRLGLALMTHTYLKETIEKMQKSAQKTVDAGQEEAGKPLFKRVTGKKSASLEEARQEIEHLSQSCILCERLENTMERYEYTLIYMWKHEPEFKKAFASSKGVCLKHYGELLKTAQKELSGNDLKEFLDTLARLMKENMERIEKDLEWFTLKFDYRNKDKPWENSQDAVERAINKLRGHSV